MFDRSVPSALSENMPLLFLHGIKKIWVTNSWFLAKWIKFWVTWFRVRWLSGYLTIFAQNGFVNFKHQFFDESLLPQLFVCSFNRILLIIFMVLGYHNNSTLFKKQPYSETSVTHRLVWLSPFYYHCIIISQSIFTFLSSLSVNTSHRNLKLSSKWYCLEVKF